MKDFFFGHGGAYNEKRNGPLEKYLETHDGISCFPLFRGYKIYKRLLDEGYLMPNWSIIRLMWNVREDEHFLVLEDGRLEGMVGGAHSGRAGVHDPKKILKMNGPCWEANRLSHEPKPRTTKQ